MWFWLYILKYYNIALLSFGGTLEYGWEAFGFETMAGWPLVLKVWPQVSLRVSGDGLEGLAMETIKPQLAECADHCLCPSGLWLEIYGFP